MAISTYAELKTAVYAWVDSSSGDFSGSSIDDLIMLGHQRIGREVRCREMEATLTGTITLGVLALPADYVDLRYAILDNEQPTKYLEKRTAPFIYKRYPHRSASGRPNYVAREFSNFIFGPYPDAGAKYTVYGSYYRRMTLTDTLTFNDVFRAHPDLYLAASIAEAIPFIGEDSRLQIWEAKYQTIAQAINAENQTEGYEGSEVDF